MSACGRAAHALRHDRRPRLVHGRDPAPRRPLHDGAAMSENTKIEWCDHTFNPWEGCQKVGPGCDHCYAETRNARFAGGTAVNWDLVHRAAARRLRTGESRSHGKRRMPSSSPRTAGASAYSARRSRTCSITPFRTPGALLDLIWNTPHLDWLLLTKRIGNAGPMITRALETAGRGVNTPWPWSNVWLGATIVDKVEADRDIENSHDAGAAPIPVDGAAAWPGRSSASSIQRVSAACEKCSPVKTAPPMRRGFTARPPNMPTTGRDTARPKLIG